MTLGVHSRALVAGEANAIESRERSSSTAAAAAAHAHAKRRTVPWRQARSGLQESRGGWRDAVAEAEDVGSWRCAGRWLTRCLSSSLWGREQQVEVELWERWGASWGETAANWPGVAAKTRSKQGVACPGELPTTALNRAAGAAVGLPHAAPRYVHALVGIRHSTRRMRWQVADPVSSLFGRTRDIRPHSLGCSSCCHLWHQRRWQACTYVPDQPFAAGLMAPPRRNAWIQTK